MARKPRKAPPLGVMLDGAQPAPFYRQIVEQLRRAILERRLAAGAPLPSSRMMAVELGCARGTVLAALDHLVAEGYLASQAGSGMAVAADLPDEMLAPARPHRGLEGGAREAPALPRRTRLLLSRKPAAANARGEPPIAFPVGQPDRLAFPFRLWAKLLEEEWRRPAWQVAGTPHPFGHSGLRQAIAAYLGAARGFSTEPDAVVITSGVRQGVSLFARLVLEAGDAAWIEEPGYAGIAQALAAAEVRAVPVPIDAAGFSPEAARRRAAEARLAIVAPSHQFPLGTVMSLKRRLALLGWAERSGSWIIEDDFDGEYRYSGRPLAPLRALDRSGRVAYLGSLSKILFPALRLSFMVLPPSLVPAAEAIIADGPAAASLLGQGALARFIADGHFAAHLRRTRLLYASRQEALVAAAERHLAGVLEIAPDPGGMHLVARPDPAMAPAFDDLEASAAAAEAGVRVSPLSVCYRGRRPSHGLILGYAGTPDAEIEPAVRALARALDGIGVPRLTSRGRRRRG